MCWIRVAGCWVLVVGYWILIVGYLLLVNGRWLLTGVCLLHAVVVGWLLLTVCCCVCLQLIVEGCVFGSLYWLRVVGCRLCVCWFYTIICWLLSHACLTLRVEHMLWVVGC